MEIRVDLGKLISKRHFLFIFLAPEGDWLSLCGSCENTYSSFAMSFKDVSSKGLITVLLQSSGVTGHGLSSQWGFVSSVDPLGTGRHLRPCDIATDNAVHKALAWEPCNQVSKKVERKKETS